MMHRWQATSLWYGLLWPRSEGDVCVPWFLVYQRLVFCLLEAAERIRNCQRFGYILYTEIHQPFSYIVHNNINGCWVILRGTDGWVVFFFRFGFSHLWNLYTKTNDKYDTIWFYSLSFERYCAKYVNQY